MVRIFVDGVVFQNNRQLGIQRYFREIIARIGLTTDVAVWMRYPSSTILPADCKQLGPDLTYVPRRRNIACRLKQAIALRRRRLQCAASDVYHSTFFTLPPVEHASQVLTVHDMIAEQFPNSLPGAEEQVASKREAIQAARVIIAISLATASDLVAFYPETASRVRVIYHGADHLRSSSCFGVSENRTRSDRYVLFVGDRKSYKNFQGLIHAAACREWPQGIHLMVIGSPFSEAEQLLLRRLGLAERVIHAGRVTDTELADRYSGASGFVFPSECEGFGFPLLEAQSQGTPVACSDIAVFREIAGRGAEFFNPKEPRAIAEAVRRLLDPQLASRLRHEGLINVARFSWDRCAAETRQVYEEACGVPNYAFSAQSNRGPVDARNGCLA